VYIMGPLRFEFSLATLCGSVVIIMPPRRPDDTLRSPHNLADLALEGCE
jgi:hypothetical protein